MASSTGGAVGDAAASPLPRDRPAATLEPEVVGGLAGDDDSRDGGFEWQDILAVDEQHLRLADRLPGDLTMLCRPDVRALGGISEWPLEKPEPELDRQDSFDRVIDAAHRDPTRFHVLLHPVDERAVLVGHHHHVDAGVDGLLDVLQRIARQLVDAVPVGDHEALELELTLEHVGDQMLLTVHLLAVPTVVRHHHRPDTGFDRGDVSGHVDLSQRRFVDDGVAAIDAVLGAAVADEVLRRRQHASRRGHVSPLHAAYGGAAERFRELRCLAEALVRSPPPFVLRHGDARSKVPVHGGSRHFERGDPSRLFDDLRIPRAAHADVVWKHDGSANVAVPVHCVDPVNDRNGQPRHQRSLLQRFGVGRPSFRGDVGQLGVAAAQDGSQQEGIDVRGRLQRRVIGLRHLADLLVERHAFE